VNLVGHVAVALEPSSTRTPSPDFLVGCMLPDLAAIARVRLAGRPACADDELGRGVAFHHVCDARFHESEWFRDANRELRDALLDAGVDRGAARACAHAGVEMLLDGELVREPRVAEHVELTLRAVVVGADDMAELVRAEDRSVWVERLQRIGRSLEPRRYGDPQGVAERLYRMTAGRPRIELAAEQIPQVARALGDHCDAIADDARAVVVMVAADAPAPTR
jgi:hypothetical protein